MGIPSEVKMETMFIKWCESIKRPTLFDTFMEGFRQGYSTKAAEKTYHINITCRECLKKSEMDVDNV